MQFYEGQLSHITAEMYQVVFALNFQGRSLVIAVAYWSFELCGFGEEVAS